MLLHPAVQFLHCLECPLHRGFLLSRSFCSFGHCCVPDPVLWNSRQSTEATPSLTSGQAGTVHWDRGNDGVGAGCFGLYAPKPGVAVGCQEGFREEVIAEPDLGR